MVGNLETALFAFRLQNQARGIGQDPANRLGDSSGSRYAGSSNIGGNMRRRNISVPRLVIKTSVSEHAVRFRIAKALSSLRPSQCRKKTFLRWAEGTGQLQQAFDSEQARINIGKYRATPVAQRLRS